jgi:imidazolonepropionase-like amidohydrolase
VRTSASVVCGRDVNIRQVTIRWTCRAAALCLLGCAVASATEPPGYAIKAGKIVTMVAGAGLVTDKTVVNDGVILIGDGKIQAVGPASSVQVPEGCTVIDASDRWVAPGIVEPHTHIAVAGGFNDMVTPINPELRIADEVDPEEPTIKQALTGGVTTVHTMPGSGTNLAGFTVIIKMDGSLGEKMILREIGAMKIAQAYNPERSGGDLGQTRMGMSWSLRQMLKQGSAYAQAWRDYEKGERQDKPPYKPELENMRRAFAGEFPVMVHVAAAWCTMQAIRMFHDENHLKTIVTHAEYGGGHLVGAEAARRAGVSIDVGPALWTFLAWNPEMDSRVHGGAAEFYRTGVRNLSINTDSTGFGEEEELAFKASMSARMGLNDEAALKAITVNPACELGIDDRVGSIEVGKDADLVIKKGSLLDVAAPVDLVLINGRIVYQRHGVDLVRGGKPAAAS